jgi:hypothetical protein
LTAPDGDPRRRLEAAGAVLLDRAAAPGELHDAAHALYALLAELTGIREDSRDRAQLDPIRLPSGVALAPRDAARSVVDFMRTARILQGLEVSIARARSRFGSPVEVLYAGCGPFAPLVLPLAARLGPGAARYTLLDVHRYSVESARSAVTALGLEPCVRAFVHADATTWRNPGPAPVHVVVAEALERALEKEPQVRIMANLAPQLAPGGLVVPERVVVRACLAAVAREVVALVDAPAERRRLVLGTVFDLNAETAGALGRGEPIPTVRFRVPDLAPDDPSDLMLTTTLVVGGDVVLDEYESGITYPAFQHRVGRVGAGAIVEVSYQDGPDPRFLARQELPTAPMDGTRPAERSPV